MQHSYELLIIANRVTILFSSYQTLCSEAH